MRPPSVSVVGKSGSGKTTLLEGLIRELKRRGYRVGTVKHDAHSFEIDRPGKDTWRHARAGSDHVVISSPQRLASSPEASKDSLNGLAAQAQDTGHVLLAQGTTLQRCLVGYAVNAQAAQGLRPFGGPHLNISVGNEGHRYTGTLRHSFNGLPGGSSMAMAW